MYYVAVVPGIEYFLPFAVARTEFMTFFLYRAARVPIQPRRAHGKSAVPQEMAMCSASARARRAYGSHTMSEQEERKSFPPHRPARASQCAEARESIFRPRRKQAPGAAMPAQSRSPARADVRLGSARRAVERHAPNLVSLYGDERAPRGSVHVLCCRKVRDVAVRQRVAMRHEKCPQRSDTVWRGSRDGEAESRLTNSPRPEMRSRGL